MRIGKLLCASIVVSFFTLPVGAQDKPGTIAALEFQKPKNGMVTQYEAGRKQKVDWHKQQKDSQPLFVWETMAGPETGTYIVGRLEQHWADLDKPSVPDQADVEEYRKVIAGYVESMVARYYELMPKVSHPGGEMTTPPKYDQIITFHVRYGKSSDFHSAIDRIHEAGEKTKWPVNYLWYALYAGGDTGTYVLVIPHTNWSDFEEKPDVKPFRDMIKEAFGQSEADSIVDRIDRAVDREDTAIVQFRPDLSYLPAK